MFGAGLPVECFVMHKLLVSILSLAILAPLAKPEVSRIKLSMPSLKLGNMRLEPNFGRSLSVGIKLALPL